MNNDTVRRLPETSGTWVSNRTTRLRRIDRHSAAPVARQTRRCSSGPVQREKALLAI